jgi:hypothetical protein
VSSTVSVCCCSNFSNFIGKGQSPFPINKGEKMKKLLIIGLIITLLLPSIVTAEMHKLSHKDMDSIHAQGLFVFLDFNIFLPSNWNDPNSTNITQNIVNSFNNNSITNSFNNTGNSIQVITQTVGNGNTGNILQNSIQLNGNAQQNLSSLVNINAVNSVIPFGINITVIHGGNFGTVNQDNHSLGILNSSLFGLGL